MKTVLCAFGIGSLFLLTSCGSENDRVLLQRKWQVPANMYVMTEDQTSAQAAQLQPQPKTAPTSLTETDDGNTRLEENFQTLLENSKDSINQTQDHQPATQVLENHPPQWAPWHMAYLLTDFSISVKGILGNLLGTGTATVTAIWAKSHSANKPVPPPEDPTAIQVSADQSPEDLEKQVTPVVNAVAAARKIPDKGALKKNIIQSAQYFTGVMSNLDSAPGSTWWVSRIRMDLTVDAAGNVTPTIAVGGEVKIRLEWHRIMNSAATANTIQAPPPPSATYTDIQKNLRGFVASMSEDLQQMSDGQEKTGDGFKAYQFIVGIGITKSATIGIAKSSGAAIGEIYFGRDVPKPKNPYVPKVTANASDSIAIIDSSPSAEHLAFAKTQGIGVETETVTDAGSDTGTPHQSVLYRANRKVFQKGLKHALQMAGHFTKDANKPNSGKWKIYEFRVNFSISLTGASKLATVAGNGVTEIDFYNENF